MKRLKDVLLITKQKMMAVSFIIISKILMEKQNGNYFNLVIYLHLFFYFFLILKNESYLIKKHCF